MTGEQCHCSGQATQHPLAAIREHVGRCTDPLLDRQIFHDQPGIAREFIDFLLEPADWPVWMDIPISAVVGLHHVNFAASDSLPTWRTAVEMLSATHWDDRVFAYWRDELRDQDFPPNDARRALRLTNLAGAVVSENGVHRLVAGVAWLLSNEGRSARLRMARTAVRLPRDSLLDEVVTICSGSQRVEVGYVSRTGSSSHLQELFVLRLTKSSTDIELIDVDTSRRSISRRCVRGARTTGELSAQQWDVLPISVIEAWRDRSWVDDSLAMAERCPTLTA